MTIKSLSVRLLGSLKKWWPILLLLALSLPAIKDLLIPAYFSMHDDLQILRIQQMDKCFHDGQIPCRWVPDAGFGYGYPLFNFYPPLPYYLAEGLHLVGFDFFWAIKLTFVLAFVLSMLFMYIFAAEFLGTWGGLVAAVFYLYAPYHSVDIYVRGAMNEAWGMVWFPLAFWSAYKLIQKGHKKYLLLLAAAFGSLLVSHNVMTLIFSPILGFWSLMWLILTKAWRQFGKLVIAAIWGVTLAAFFFLPVTLESKMVHVETMTIGYFNYLAHFADLKQLFFSRFWGYGGSTWGPNDGMAFPVGHLHWIAALVALVISLVAWFKFRNRFRSIILITIFFNLVGFFYIFLTHSRSVWFWDHLPLLYYAQFPWRLLAIPAFAFSFLAGSLIWWLKKLPHQIIITVSIMLIGAVILWNLPFFHIEKPVTVTAEEKLSGALWELQVTGGIFDYLPKSASRPPGSPAVTTPEFITGRGGILNFNQGSNWLTFQADVSSSSAKIRLPLYDFPKLKVTVDGKAAPYTHDEDLGRVEIILSRGLHTVSAQILNTPIRTLANALTIVAALLWLWSWHKQK